MNHPLRSWMFVALIAGLAGGAGLSAQPRPGDLWREYPMALGSEGMFRIGGEYGGAKNLDVPFPLAPSMTNRTPYALDLTGALRAELTIGYNQSHNGAPELYVALNDHPYVKLPRPASIPSSAYYFHIFPTIPVPLGHLRADGNTFRLTNDKWMKNPAGYDPGFDQSLAYELILRIYYDPALRPGPTGAIQRPVPGGVLDASQGRQPVLEASASSPNGSIQRVDFLAHYEDYDRTCDTQYRRWHWRRKSFDRNPTLTLVDHPGSDLTAPYAVAWNMTWVPDQAQPMMISAFVTDASGLTTMLPPATGITLHRPDRSVELGRPYNTPVGFNTANSKPKLANFDLRGELRTATEARLFFQYWPFDDNDDAGVNLNDFHHTLFRPLASFPVTYLRAGRNSVEPEQGGHHGMEIYWPGIAVYVAYRRTPHPEFLQQPEDLFVRAGETARLVARVAGEPEPSYRWQVQPPGSALWMDLTGANAATLELPDRQEANDEYRYRLVATNPSGTEVSRAARLRVATRWPAFQEKDGMVSLEAENYDAQDRPGPGPAWDVYTLSAGYSGRGYAWNLFEGQSTETWLGAPTLRYRFHLSAAGDYLAWFRCQNREVGKNHTLSVGFDGQFHAPVLPDKSVSAWQWVRVAARTLPAGDHELQVMRRADGLLLDKIVLTRDPAYQPDTVASGRGPAESVWDLVWPNRTRILHPTLHSRVTAGAQLTLRGSGENLQWSIPGASPAEGQGETLTVTLPRESLPHDQLDIALAGAGGTTTLSLPITPLPLQPVSTDGLVVVEAEDFHYPGPRPATPSWQVQTHLDGAVGRALGADGPEAAPRGWAEGSTVIFEVYLAAPGRYTPWLRVRPTAPGGGPVYLGLAGHPSPEPVWANGEGWAWVPAAPVTIETAGRQAWALVLGRGGLSVDRWLLSAEPGYHPAAGPNPEGPSASPAQWSAPWCQYSAWPAGSVGERHEDPDADGLDNFSEYFLSTDPLQPDPGWPLPAWDPANRRWYFSWTVQPNPDAPFRLEWLETTAPGSHGTRQAIYPRTDAGTVTVQQPVEGVLFLEGQWPTGSDHFHQWNLVPEPWPAPAPGDPATRAYFHNSDSRIP